MKVKRIHNWILLPTSLSFLIIVLLVLGVFFRFANLERKVYWRDEALTSLQISGYTQSEFVQQVFDGHVIGIEDLQKYQRPNPEKSLIDTIKSLAIETPEHPPLYYVLIRLWGEYFGNSVATLRSFSAFISLLVFPSTYWLCRELFKSSLVGWVAIALIAVSPFHVLYAQEAREYSLWTVTILLSSAALLQAIRLKTRFYWAIYSATLTLAIYCHPFSALVAIGHGIYVVATEGFRLSKTFRAYLAASLAALLSFLPWILIVITHLRQIQTSMAWALEKSSLLDLVGAWFTGIMCVLFNFGLGSVGSFRFYLLILILLMIVSYPIYFLCRQAPKQIWLFVLTLMGVTSLALILPDLIFGGARSFAFRYFIPFYLGIELAIAYLFSTKIISANMSQRRIWQTLLAVLISVGVASCAISSPKNIGLSKAIRFDMQLPQIINNASRPLLIGSNYGYTPTEILSLSYLLEPKVRFQLVVEPKIPEIPDEFSDVFLFTPFGFSQAWQSELEKKYKIKPIENYSYKFGRLEK